MITELYGWMDQIIKHSLSIWMAILFITFIWASTVWSIHKWIQWYGAYKKLIDKESKE